MKDRKYVHLLSRQYSDSGAGSIGFQVSLKQERLMILLNHKLISAGFALVSILSRNQDTCVEINLITQES